MSYSEGYDLVQNIKALQSFMDRIESEFSKVEPSIQDILNLKDQFDNLRDTTIGILQQYEGQMAEQAKQMEDLLENCRSQFQQVTDDVESLVNLEANFSQMKDKIEQIILIGQQFDKLGTLVWMDEGKPIPVEKRTPGKYYLQVIEQLRFANNPSTGEAIPIPDRLRIGPNMGISFDDP